MQNMFHSFFVARICDCTQVPGRHIFLVWSYARLDDHFLRLVASAPFCVRLLAEVVLRSASVRALSAQPLWRSPALVLARSGFWLLFTLGSSGAWSSVLFFIFFLVLDDVWPHQRLSIARLLSSQIYFTLWFSTSLALLASVPLDYSGARHHRS